MQVTIKYSDKNIDIKRAAMFDSGASNESKAFLEAVACVNDMVSEICEMERTEMFKPGMFSQVRLKDGMGKQFNHSRNGIDISIHID